VPSVGPANTRTSWLSHWVSVPMSVPAKTLGFQSAVHAPIEKRDRRLDAAGSRGRSWPPASCAGMWRPSGGAIACWPSLRPGVGFERYRHGMADRPRRLYVRRASLVRHRQSCSQGFSPCRLASRRCTPQVLASRCSTRDRR
jgi:hypothetical protein